MGKHSKNKREVLREYKRSERFVKPTGVSGPSLQRSPRLRVHDVRRKQAFKNAILAVVGVVILACVASVIWGFFFLRSVGDDIQTSAETERELSLVVEEPEPREPFVVLLLGSDMRPGEEVARADTIIVARVDTEQQQVSMLSIPRDTRVDIPGHGIGKINSAIAQGGVDTGPALMVETVEDFLDVDVNYYVEVNFIGLQAVVDALGGVWIDVETEIDDWKAASHSPNNSARYIPAGYQLLDGEHALTYVRSRDYPDADFTRMRNQQAFFKALASQVGDMGNVLRIPAMVGEMAENLTTNMRVGDIISAAQALRGMSADDMYTATVMGEWRSPYVWTDEALRDELVESFLVGRDFDAEAEPTEPVDPSTVTVAIRNGAGVGGVAGGAASILDGLGYVVDEVGNANQFVYGETLVVYRDQEQIAEQIAGELPDGKVVASRGMYVFSTDILVVVGSDWTGPTADWEEQ